MKYTLNFSSPLAFVCLIAVIGALGGLLFGFDTGVIAGALLFIGKTFPLSTGIKELIVSSVVLGALFSALASGKLADYWGRRTMLMVAALAFILGTILTLFAKNVFTLIIGRLIVGGAIGISSYTVPLFISEMAPAKHRGALVLLNGIMITSGQAFAFLVSYWLADTGNWRLMFGVGLIPASLLLLGMIFSPCSPRWLILKGMPDQARLVLSKIRPPHEVESEWLNIQGCLPQSRGTWSTLFSRSLRPVLLVGIGLGILQQTVGINTVMYYGPTLFESAGFKSAAAQILATFGMGLVNATVSLIAFLIIDRMGRRKLLMWGASIAGLSLVFVGYQFFHPQANLRWATIGGLVIYIAGYAISVGSLFWLIISEIYPLAVRSHAMSLATAIQWGANFLVSLTFLSILQAIGPAYTLWLYASMCGLTVLFTYFYVPETKGISLETIEKNIMNNRPSRYLGESAENPSILKTIHFATRRK